MVYAQIMIYEVTLGACVGVAVVDRGCDFRASAGMAREAGADSSGMDCLNTIPGGKSTMTAVATCVRGDIVGRIMGSVTLGTGVDAAVIDGRSHLRSYAGVTGVAGARAISCYIMQGLNGRPRAHVTMAVRTAGVGADIVSRTDRGVNGNKLWAMASSAGVWVAEAWIQMAMAIG